MTQYEPDITPEPMPVYDPLTRVTTLPNGIRLDDQGRVLCTAHKTTGDRGACEAPAVHGMKVCRHHGGSIPAARAKAKLRLAELVNPAIATLGREMANTQGKSSDRLAAANSVLDRTGWGRVTRVETADAREMLVQRLMELRDEEYPLVTDDEDKEQGDATQE